MKHRHYQPKCPVLAVAPGNWQQALQHASKSHRKIGVVSYNRPHSRNPRIIFKRDRHTTLSHYARELYSNFLDAEQAGVELLLVESVPRRGIGLAIMDRITRASQ